MKYLKNTLFASVLVSTNALANPFESGSSALSEIISGVTSITTPLFTVIALILIIGTATGLVPKKVGITFVIILALLALAPSAIPWFLGLFSG